MIHSINELQEADVKGKKVLVRVDFNVPVKDGKVVDDYRIVRALPTIKFLKEKGAKVLLISHIETKDVEAPTLVPVFAYFKKNNEAGLHDIHFVEDIFSDDASTMLKEMQNGEVILFENIRQYEEEKKNDAEFGKKLAALADIYVNDAFAVSHREHASVVGVAPHIPAYAGLLLADEIAHLKIDENVPRPFLFIIGGAKFDTKLPLIQKFLDKADNVFVGGALANDIFKAKGMDVKDSLVSDGVDVSAVAANPKLIVPADVVWDGRAIMDAGVAAVEELRPLIQEAKYILWNGPIGNYEKGFKQGTVALAKLIGESSAVSVVGGGDTLASIKELGLVDEFTFISTGGGAMLDLLLEGTLPGITALDR